MGNKVREFTLEENQNIFSAAKKINKNGKRFLAITNKKGKFLGTLTDADIRRGLVKGIKKETIVRSIFHRNAKFIFFDQKYYNNFFLKFFKKYKSIDALPILNKNYLIEDIVFRDEILQKKKKLDCLILAGGFGKRLSPITKSIAKPLIKFNQKPYICSLIEKIKNANVDKIYISVFFKSNQVKTIIKKFFPTDLKSGKVKIIFENKPLGTIGSLKKIKNTNNSILVLNSDVIFNVNIDNFLHLHDKNKNSITVVTSDYNLEIPFGVIINRGNLMKEIIEKPNYNFLINCGIYIIDSKIKKLIKNNEKVNMDELLKRALKRQKKIGLYPLTEDILDYGSHKNLKIAKKNFNKLFYA
jgi:dTDP-glucose pyrophosphorylase